MTWSAQEWADIEYHARRVRLLQVDQSELAEQLIAFHARELRDMAWWSGARDYWRDDAAQDGLEMIAIDQFESEVVSDCPS